MIIKFYTKKDAQSVVGTLTATSKMPCKSYSLPTAECRTGRKLAQINGTICSSCYANAGFYKVYAAKIQASQYVRFNSIDHPDWVTAMVALIGKDTYFRWHDSGDIRDLAHLAKIAQVAELTPHCRHWLPTRERTIVKDFIKSNSVPDNLIIRLSAVFFDQVSPSFAGLNTSTAHKTKKPIGFECPAPKQGNSCANCRACWNKEILNVSYKAH